MKLIDKVVLVLFSILILIISVILCLLVFGWVDIEFMGEVVVKTINDPIYSNVILGVSVICILLAIKSIFFHSSMGEKNEYKNGILLENADGKLLITKETIENIVIGVVKGFDSTEDISTKIEFDVENNVRVFISFNVKENAIIKELSTNLQTKIKEAIKKTSDLEVKEVNIKVKNVEPVKQMGQE